MSESTNNSDNPEAVQAVEDKNGESNEECTKEPGGIFFSLIFFIMTHSCVLKVVRNNGFKKLMSF